MNSNYLKFLNHSSLIIGTEETLILCDPWFKGSAFNNGWRLLYEDSHDINQIIFDYIWISHEHPDHFSIPTLSEILKHKQFLYQETSDKKVKNWLESKNHSVYELADGKQYEAGDIKLISFVSDGYDSTALFTLPGGDQFLNINDARIELGETISSIKEYDLTNLKLISIQFSYANWAGNELDNKIPFHQQDLVIERIRTIYETFKPKKILLFASYVYYSHEENFFWNKYFWLDYVTEKLSKLGISFIVPIPNQIILFNDIVSKDFKDENRLAIEFWRKKTQGEQIKDFSNKNITIEEIESAYTKWFNKIWQNNSLNMVLNSRNIDFNLRVKIIDHNCIVNISLFKERFSISSSPIFDCVISSETLIFLLRNNFGRGTVTVNSRIQFNYEYAHKFFIFFFIPYANNIGKIFKNNMLTSKVLKSIGNTSVMMSIFKFNQVAFKNFEKDLLLFN